MSANTSFRYQIEASIIAEALIYDQAFAELITFLKPINFTEGRVVNTPEGPQNLFRFLWQCMAEMYPRTPIDIVTLTYYVYRKFKVEIHRDANEITMHQNANMNRTYYGLLIIEMDLRKNFLRLIKSFTEARKDPEMKLDLMQMEDFIADMKNDVFEGIETTLGYFQSSDKYLDEREIVEEFKSKIDKRVDEIRRLAQVKSVMHNLMGFYSFNNPRKTVINCLVDLIRVCMVKNEIPIDFEERVLGLRNQIVA
jgi:hypothetical protein